MFSATRATGYLSWSLASTPGRVRELGGTGGKIMVYLRSDLRAANEHNIRILKQVIADFAAEDLLLVVEFLTYQVDGESADDYASKFSALIESGTNICLEVGSKVLKLRYPGTGEACANVSKLCGDVPWAVLSAGVAQEHFMKQIEIAMADEAPSGFIVAAVRFGRIASRWTVRCSEIGSRTSPCADSAKSKPCSQAIARDTSAGDLTKPDLKDITERVGKPLAIGRTGIDIGGTIFGQRASQQRVKFLTGSREDRS